MHCTIATYLGSQWATTDSIITHLLELMAIMGTSVQTKTGDAVAHVSSKMKVFAYCNVTHITSLPHTPMG